MKINVTENKVSIKEEQILNENEYNIHKIQFDFSSEYTDDLVKVALFSIDNHTYKKIISNNECDIPPEVLTQRGYSILGVYAYKTEQDTLVLRYSPSPTKISVYDGSYKADAENSEPITPSEIEQYQQILQNSLQQFQNQYNALVEETEGDIQAIEDELQRKVDEGYFDGEDGFSPIAKVIQKSNGATIEIEDKNGKTTADVLNGQDGYSPIRGIDYWTEEDKQEVEEEATQQIEGKIEEYNDNAAEKLSQYNQNSVQKTNDYNTNAEQKTTSFNTNATNKLTEYNTNHTEKMSTYNNNSTEKLNAFNENATQKTEDFDTHTEEIQDNIENLQEENARLKATLPTTTGEGQDITLDKTAEMEFVKPPLPMGNSEQVQYSGKNKINITFNSGTHSGVTWTVNSDKSITLNGTSTANEFLKIGETEVVENTQYRLSGCPSTGSSNTYRLYIATSGIATGYDNGTGTNITAEGSGIVNVNIAVYSGVTLNNVVFKPQLEEGSTTTAYEPYVGGTASPNPDYPQEITNVTGDVEVKVQNKNLLKYPYFNTTLTTKGITYTDNGDGSITINGTATEDAYFMIYSNLSGNRLKLQKGSYIVSANENVPAGITATFAPRNSDGSSISGVSNMYLNSSNRIINQTINQDFEMFASIQVTSGTTVSNYTFKPMFEKGTTSTPYTPHKEQVLPLTLGNIELCKIGDYQDYFYKASNKWYLHKEIEKVIFDGSENWNRVMSTNNAIARFGITTIDYLKGLNTGKIPTFMSNYFIPVNFNTVYDGISGGISWWWNDNIKQLILCLNDDRSLENFKTWLSTHNTIVYYVIATPTDTEITDTTLISQLEAINNAISYEEQTNIRGSSNGSNPIFSVEGYQSTKLVLQDISNAIIALGGV